MLIRHLVGASQAAAAAAQRTRRIFVRFRWREHRHTARLITWALPALVSLLVLPAPVVRLVPAVRLAPAVRLTLVVPLALVVPPAPMTPPALVVPRTPEVRSFGP